MSMGNNSGIGSVRLSHRMARLGTESAFNVAAEAQRMAAGGHTVFPFHIGDLNFATPPAIIDAALRAAREGKTGYCSYYGLPELRQALADQVSSSHRVSYRLDNVAIQPGGKPVIGKAILALLNPGDEVLIPNPGYPIYESLVEYFECRAIPYPLVAAQDRFAIDIDFLTTLVTPRTRMLVLNDLHNPTGADASTEELRGIAEFAALHDLWVLADEAYAGIRYSGDSVSIASMPGMTERTIVLYSFSKTFAMTGWRLGAAIGPRSVIDAIAQLNLNQESCTNHFAQYGAIEALRSGAEPSRAMVGKLQERRDRLVSRLNDIPGIRCFSPRGTFHVYPDVTELMARKGFDDYESFRRAMLRDTGVAVCTRQHFGRPVPWENARNIRLAFGGVTLEQIDEGLDRLAAWSA